MISPRARPSLVSTVSHWKPGLPGAEPKLAELTERPPRPQGPDKVPRLGVGPAHLLLPSRAEAEVGSAGSTVTLQNPG